MAKPKKYQLIMTFHKFDDLMEHVKNSCGIDLTIKEADWLDTSLPSKNFNIKKYVLKKIESIGGSYARN